MGQTLTHGIYLPDEGERNCYNGLAGNWQLLDGAVGTVAEHTTQIAGKANAVHTHTKSDITDLLNSNFIPSANNSYDLGSSSYQWNNIYAKNYFYNGTAWGLDKANVWTGENTFVSSFSKRNNAMTLGTTPAEVLYNSLFFKDKNNTLLASLDQQFNTDGSAHFVLRIAPNQSGATRVGAWEYIHDGTNRTMTFNATLCPVGGYHALGTSTNKWKTLNGINPGALSLPRGYTEEGADKHYINIASTIQTLDGTLYYYTMPDNGWISVRAEQANQVHVTTDNWKFGQSIYSNTVTTLIVSTPFRKGDTVAIKVIATTLEHARFYPMQGNV